MPCFQYSEATGINYYTEKKVGTNINLTPIIQMQISQWD